MKRYDLIFARLASMDPILAARQTLRFNRATMQIMIEMQSALISGLCSPNERTFGRR